MQFHEVLKQAINGLKIRKIFWDSDQYLTYDPIRKTLVTKSGVPTCSSIEECLNADWEVLVAKRIRFGSLSAGAKFKIDDTQFHHVLTKTPIYNAMDQTKTQRYTIADEQLVVVVE